VQQPAAAGTGVQSQIQTFDRGRNNIFAPLGTAPSTLSREAIEALPQGTNSTVRDVLLQLPGVTQDSAASGNLHVRNEHANVSYRINGILLPDGLGAFGQFLDSSFVGSLALITGALPAQYGLRTAGIVDITTAKFDNVSQIGVYGGSRGTTNYSAQYGGVTGSTEYFFTGRFLNTILGIENPTPSLNAVHDGSHQDRSFAYISTIIDPTTRLSFIGGTATNWFQIPNRPGLPPSFTAFGISDFPSSQLDETQLEHYKFGVLALQKSTNDVDLQLAYFTRTSSIQFMPDTLGDLMFNGVATNGQRCAGGWRIPSQRGAHAACRRLRKRREDDGLGQFTTPPPRRLDEPAGTKSGRAGHPLPGRRHQRAARMAGRRLSARRMEDYR
jgi:hypothetical protein